MMRLKRLLIIAAGTIGVIGAAAPASRAQAPSAAASHESFSPADVRFMQGMIAHHAQALEMTALVPSHTANRDIHLLAERIEVSQKDEIGLMRHWLLDRHQEAPDPLGAASHDRMAGMPGMSAMAGMKADSMPMMPGMLTKAQMKQLADAKGAAFDRLFLTLMIQHHEGALTMVKQLFAVPGAGQEPAAFQFASDVQTDQTAEIARMQALLATMHR